LFRLNLFQLFFLVIAAFCGNLFPDVSVSAIGSGFADFLNVPFS